MGNERFSATQAVVDGYVREGLLPGAAVLVRHKGSTVQEYAGSVRLDPPEPATVEHIWAVASISKPVAVTALMQLVEAGYLRLDQPVVELLPRFGPGKEAVLVRHLACHSSGVPDDWPEREALETLGPVAAIGTLDLIFTPGTACQYTTATFELISAIVQRLTGLDWDTYTRERIFAPLGMQSSSYSPPSSWDGRIAVAYDTEGGVPEWPNDPWMRRQAMAGGGLFSTLRDLAAFGQAFLDGGRGILSPVSHREMTTLQTGGLSDQAGVPVTWGLGWYLNQDGRKGSFGPLSREAYGHGGATGTWVAIDPERDLVIAQLGNRVGLPFETTLRMQSDLAAAVVDDLGE